LHGQDFFVGRGDDASVRFFCGLQCLLSAGGLSDADGCGDGLGVFNGVTQH
jgi:hypothetical protein